MRSLRGIGLTVLGLLIVIVGALVLTADPGTIAEARPFDRVEITDDAVVVHWTGRPCEWLNTERTQVAESSGQVQATLFVDVPIDSCAGGDVARSGELPLQRIGAGGEVIDGACLLPGYFNDSRCHD